MGYGQTTWMPPGLCSGLLRNYSGLGSQSSANQLGYIFYGVWDFGLGEVWVKRGFDSVNKRLFQVTFSIKNLTHCRIFGTFNKVVDHISWHDQKVWALILEPRFIPINLFFSVWKYLILLLDNKFESGVSPLGSTEAPSVSMIEYDDLVAGSSRSGYSLAPISGIAAYLMIDAGFFVIKSSVYYCFGTMLELRLPSCNVSCTTRYCNAVRWLGCCCGHSLVSRVPYLKVALLRVPIPEQNLYIETQLMYENGNMSWWTNERFRLEGRSAVDSYHFRRTMPGYLKTNEQPFS